MKRLAVLFLILAAFGGAYNFSVLRNVFCASFWDNSYRKGDFADAETRYQDVLKSLSGSMFLEADTLYNLGNTFYRLGEKTKEETRLNLWKKSVENYETSLSLRPDTATQENLDFVKKKIEKEEKAQESKQEEQKKEEKPQSGTGTTGKKERSKTQSGNTDQRKEGQENGAQSSQSWARPGQNRPQAGGQWSNQGSYNTLGGQSKDNIGSGLSDTDREDLKKYTENLKQFQKQNGKLLNPDKSAGGVGSLSEQIRNFFGSDSFFQDVLPSNDGKKDW